MANLLERQRRVENSSSPKMRPYQEDVVQGILYER